MALTVSFAPTTGDPNQTKTRSLIDEGSYQGKLVGAEAKLSRNGNPMIKLDLTIIGDETGAETKYVGFKKNSYLSFMNERQQRDSVSVLKSLLGDSFSDVATDVEGKLSVDLDEAAKKLVVIIGDKVIFEITHSEKDGDKSDWANNVRLLEAPPANFG